MDEHPETHALARRERPTVVAVLGTALTMVVPPVIAAIVGGVALAVVVGMLSIFAGLLGFSFFIYKYEEWHRQELPPLPRARVIPKS